MARLPASAQRVGCQRMRAEETVRAEASCLGLDSWQTQRIVVECARRRALEPLGLQMLMEQAQVDGVQTD